jgi:hypothetical protein
MLSLLIAGTLVVAAPSPKVAVEELRDRALVELLGGLHMELDVDAGNAYALRVFHDRTPGECDPTKPCEKDRLIVVVSTIDEYPESKAFRMPIRGEFRGVAILDTPGQEDHIYRLLLRTSPLSDDRESCVLIEAGLKSMVAKPAPCGEQTPTKSP